MMTIQELDKDYSEAVKQISENRNKMTEGRRNELTIALIEREIDGLDTKELDLRTRIAVFEKFKSGHEINISLIQRQCRCGYFSASRVLENLINDGLVKSGNTKYDSCIFL